MNEQELIEKIKILHIEPDKQWVSLTKKQILNSSPKKMSFGFFNWLFNQGIAVAFGLSIIVLAGVFLYNNMVSFQMAELDVQTLETVISHLGAVQSDLNTAMFDLNKVQDPNQVVQLQETVGLTVASGKKVVQGVKKMVETKAGEKLIQEKSPDVLTALTEIETTLTDIEETMAQKQKALAEQLISEWEQKSLTEEQQKLLEQAKTYYDNQEFDQALIKAIEVSQKTGF